MANSQGILLESIWRDKDFRAIPRTAQATYGELISQKELDRAGIQPLMVSKWSKGCDEITDADIWADLQVLEERRFVFYDIDTDELFIRAYMRTCDVVRYPNILKNALRCARLVASEKLRHELAKELRRLRRAEASAVADEIDPGEPFENQSEGFPKGSETVPERLNGSETVPKPPGMGKGMGISPVPEIETLRAEQSPTVSTGSAIQDPPLPRCPKHIETPTLEPCGPCKTARLANEAHARQQAKAQGVVRSTEARRVAEVRARAIARCDLCDDDGYRGTRLCDHDPDGQARTARGSAAVRAALVAKSNA